jgi:hypothetical protein
MLPRSIVTDWFVLLKAAWKGTIGMPLTEPANVLVSTGLLKMTTGYVSRGTFVELFTGVTETTASRSARTIETDRKTSTSNKETMIKPKNLLERLCNEIHLPKYTEIIEKWKRLRPVARCGSTIISVTDTDDTSAR